MKIKKHLTQYGIHSPPMKKVFRWKMRTLLQKRRRRVADDDFKLTVNSLTSEELNREDDFIFWLGHATFYIQLDGVKILTDPVLGDIPMYKRRSKIPIALEALKPDIILITHGHFDHLDLPTLQKLGVYNRQTKLIMPTNLSAYIKQKANISELGWDERLIEKGIKITALPASHWHRRGVFDFNRALWCSFMIESKQKTLYFAGDTAFDTHFAKIAENFKIDTALMPIGAYLPREVMQDNHIDPQEALNATEILKAKRMIPYHYGTFKLSDEPVGEPHSWIKKLTQTTEIAIDILAVGEISQL